MKKEEIEDRINNYSYSLVSEAYARCKELNEIEHIWITSLINGIWYVHKKGEFDPINNYIQNKSKEKYVPWDPIKELEEGHKKQMKDRICTSKQVEELRERLTDESCRFGSIFKPDQFQYIYNQIHYDYFKLLRSLEYLHAELKRFEEKDNE